MASRRGPGKYTRDCQFLLFAHVNETEIEADLSLSEVSFVLPTQQALTRAIDLSTLGVSGLRHIELPQAVDQIAQTPASSDDGAEFGIGLEAASDAKRRGTITLSPLALPAATSVWVKYSGLPRQYRLSLKGTKR